jgi:hypothetical protein
LCDLRDKESYEEQLTELDNPDLSVGARSALLMEFGINNRCPLSNLEYFDATKHFAHDLMHVVFEGIVNSGNCLLLSGLESQHELSITTLNEKIVQLKPTREFTTPAPIILHEVRQKHYYLNYLNLLLKCNLYSSFCH